MGAKCCGCREKRDEAYAKSGAYARGSKAGAKSEAYVGVNTGPGGGFTVGPGGPNVVPQFFPAAIPAHHGGGPYGVPVAPQPQPVFPPEALHPGLAPATFATKNKGKKGKTNKRHKGKKEQHATLSAPRPKSAKHRSHSKSKRKSRSKKKSGGGGNDKPKIEGERARSKSRIYKNLPGTAEQQQRDARKVQLDVAMGKIAYPPLSSEVAEKAEAKKRKPETQTTLKVVEYHDQPQQKPSSPYAGIEPRREEQTVVVDSLTEMPKSKIRGPPPLTPFPEPRHTNVNVTRTSPLGGWSRYFCSSCNKAELSGSSSTSTTGVLALVPVIGVSDDEERRRERSRMSLDADMRKNNAKPPDLRAGGFHTLDVRAHGRDTRNRKEFSATFPGG